MIRDPKTSVIGLVLIACGALLVVTSKHVTPDALAILSAGAGFLAASDSRGSTRP
jgi:hypothetical protein